MIQETVNAIAAVIASDAPSRWMPQSTAIAKFGLTSSTVPLSTFQTHFLLRLHKKTQH
jgi:hypothetical protein